MNIIKIILGIILIAIIPTHWFIAGITLAALFGFPGFFILLLWLGLLIGGFILIFQGVKPEEKM
jgi:hypothetical protein